MFSVLTCEVPSIDNGVSDPVTGDNVDFGSSYTITCNSGFTYAATGSVSGSCEEDGNFSDPIPACESKIFIVFQYCIQIWSTHLIRFMFTLYVLLTFSIMNRYYLFL